MTVTDPSDMPRGRYKVLLTYDAEDWAFHQECLDLLYYLHLHAPGMFECTVAKAGRHPDPSRFDIVYSSAWYDPRLINHPRSISQLSSYSFWADCDKARNRAHLLGKWKYLAVKNQGMLDRLTPDDHPSPRLLGHQINTGKWPYQAPRTRDPGDILRVGFAGHQQASKGWAMVQEAVARVDGAELVSVTWEGDRILPERMPDFYHALDCYVCMSKQEGGPRTGLEAMLSGAPLITTRVGQVGEMVWDIEHAIIVERDTQSLADALDLLDGLATSRGAQAMSRRANALTSERVRTDGKAWAELFIEAATQ